MIEVCEGSIVIADVFNIVRNETLVIDDEGCVLSDGGIVHQVWAGDRIAFVSHYEML